MWAGHEQQCSFNGLVDFTNIMASRGYQFALTGMLLQTPQRMCHHTPSASFIENQIIVIGEKPMTSTSIQGPLYQLIKPFRFSSWAIFASFFLMFIIVSIAITYRFPFYRGLSVITTFFIFVGERDDALAYENNLVVQAARQRRKRRKQNASSIIDFQVEVDMPPSVQEDQVTQQDVSPTDPVMPKQRKDLSSVATRHDLAMTLFRISVLAYVAIFTLFYEVAVVNFIFLQEKVELRKAVNSLSRNQLESYSVLKESSLEAIWNITGILSDLFLRRL